MVRCKICGSVGR